jgi:2-polyprenyl-3-methyl-5-hydroxy-6-metoxy-1,4-benzoquinol methylase
MFEAVHLKDGRYHNIFMTHVLEHVENPVRVLKRVNNEWLASGGRFFLACPNANAASRQIAVKMNLIDCNHGRTTDEEAHGHIRTYSLDLLECHARNAGLKVIHRGGIFFKPLANFQIDKAKAAGIIDDAYLEGCYALGQVYPDLCASIYLICEKGDLQ